MKEDSTPHTSNSCERGSIPGGTLPQQDRPNSGGKACTAGASADRGVKSDDGVSCDKTVCTSADSPTGSAGAGFAFAGTTDCPTPSPMGQKVSRLKGSIIAAPTELFALRSEQPTAESPKEIAAAERPDKTAAAQRLRALAEQGSSQLFPAAAAKTETDASPVEAPARTASAGTQPTQHSKPLRPQALLPPTMAGVCELQSKVFVPDPRAHADVENTEATHTTPKSSGSQGVHIKLLEAILDKLCALDHNQTFTYPVPSSVPGYSKHIKHPMCLSDMRQCVRACGYGTWRHFTSDFALIISNAHAFNTEGDQWYRAASTLERNGRMILKEEEETGSAAVHALHPGGVAAALKQERVEAEAAAAQAALVPAKRSRPPMSSPEQTACQLPFTPRTPLGHPGAATGASGHCQPRSTSFSSAGATDSAARVSLDVAATAGAGDAAAIAEEYATEPDLCYSSFSDGYDSSKGSFDPDLGSLFRRLQPNSSAQGSAGNRGNSKTAHLLGGTVTAKRLAAVTAHLQQRIVEMPLLGGSGRGNQSSPGAETLLPRRQRGKPTKAAILSAEAALAAEAARGVPLRQQGLNTAAATSAQPANSAASLASAQDSPEVGALSAAAPAPGRRTKRKASKAWQQERDSIAWRGHFVSMRMRALQHEHRRLQLAEEALQVKSNRLCGPSTPPQAGATAAPVPVPAPLPMATKHRRKRATFPHLSAAELLIHPVFGTHANMGKPAQLLRRKAEGGVDQFSSSEVAARAAAAASQASAYHVFPAGAHGSPVLPPLRLLRSNAAGFGDGSRGRGHGAYGLDLPTTRDRVAQLGSNTVGNGDSAGSPALTARARARRNAAYQVSSVQMGPAGGTETEAAYATAAAGASRSQVPGEDDVFYAARAHAVLDIVRHESAGNRELLNSIIRSDQAAVPEPGKRPGTAGGRGRSVSGANRPATGRVRVGSQPAKPSKRRKDEGHTDPGTPHIATGIGAPKFVERQKAVEIPLPEVRLLSIERRTQQTANIERFRAEAKLKAKSSKAKSAGSKGSKSGSKAAGDASVSGGAASAGVTKEAVGSERQDPNSDASDEESFLQRHMPLEQEERHRFMSYSSGSGPMKSRAKGGTTTPRGGSGAGGATPRAGASAGCRVDAGPARTATAPAALMGPPPTKEVKKGGLRQSTEKKGRNRKGPLMPTAAAASAAAVTAAGKISASASASAASLCTPIASNAQKNALKGTPIKATPK